METVLASRLHAAAYDGNASAIVQAIREGANISDVMEGWTPLEVATVAGQTGIVELLLAAGADPNVEGTESGGALLAAAKSGHVDCARALVAAGAVLETENSGGETPLMAAAAFGHDGVVLALLRAGANPLHVNRKNGKSALHLASEIGAASTVRILLEGKCDEEAKDGRGRTPIHAAAEIGSVDTVLELLAGGANPESRDGVKRSTPLHLAAARGHVSVMIALLEDRGDVRARATLLEMAAVAGEAEVLRALLTPAVKIDVRRVDGATPLHLAARAGHVEATQMLLERGANVNHRARHGRTPLMEVVGAQYHSLVPMLIGAHADLEIPDSRGRTPLWVASERDDHDVVLMLLEAGADADKKFDGETLLHRSTRHHNLHALKAFLEYGADTEVKDDADRTPLSLAAAARDFEAMQLLMDYGADTETRLREWGLLHYAATHNEPTLCKVLISNGAIIEQVDHVGRTPLHVAVDEEHYFPVRELVDGGADVDAVDNVFWTPLHLAAKRGFVGAIKVLLEAGAKVDVRDGDDWTPLLIAAHEGAADVVAELVRGGANVELRHSGGWAPLHEAAVHGNGECVAALLDGGADAEACETTGLTPLECAIRADKWDTAETLLYAEGASTVTGGALHPTRSLLSTALQLPSVLSADLLDQILSHDANPERAIVRFFRAAATDDRHIFATMLSHGTANLSDCGPDGVTALHIAAALGHCDLVQDIVDEDARVARLKTSEHCFPNCGHQIPLHFAAQRGYDKIVRILLTAVRGTTTYRDDSGRSALDLAISQGNEDAACEILAIRPSIDPPGPFEEPYLSRAVSQSLPKVVHSLLRLGAKPDATLTIQAEHDDPSISPEILHLISNPPPLLPPPKKSKEDQEQEESKHEMIPDHEAFGSSHTDPTIPRSFLDSLDAPLPVSKKPTKIITQIPVVIVESPPSSPSPPTTPKKQPLPKPQKTTPKQPTPQKITAIPENADQSCSIS